MHRLFRVLLTAAFCLAPASPAHAAGQDVADDVFYQFMPIAWRDSDGDASRFGDFGGMTASLDYLDSLGVTAIWMNPIHPSPAYHGYQHGDGGQLNPWFGTEAEFTAFLEAAHARGMRVFVDFVAYGISHNSTWFQSAYGNPASPYDSWLAFTNGSNTSYLGSVYSSWNGNSVGFIHWDLRNASAANLVTQWAEKWLDPNQDGVFTDGLDGYRLDHVWVTYPNGPDGWGYHIDSFWAPWRAALRTVNPDVFVFAEQADWGIHGQQLFPGMDAAFTKPFEFAARDALTWESAGPLRSQMQSTLNALASASNPGTFLCTIGNHDVGRLASAIGDSFAKGKAAAAVLLTQPFPPVLYYGDEIGMRGLKNTGLSGDASDIPMREPMKWNAVAGPPMSNYFVLNAGAYANRISRDNDGRSVEEQEGNPGSLLEAYRGLIGVRHGSVALRRGSYRLVPNQRDAVWTFVRNHDDQQVLVAINLSGTAVNDVLNLSSFDPAGGSTVPEDLVGGAAYPAITTANRGAYPLSLPAYGYVVLDADLLEIPFAPIPKAIDGWNIPGDFGTGFAFATQNNATAMGNNVSELNQLFLRSCQDTLFVGITGNLAADGTGLALFLDTEPGGQTALDLSATSPPPYGPDEFTGLRFDDGFAPDHLLYLNAPGGSFYVDQYELFAGGGLNKIYRGQGTVGSTIGDLSGGSNPNGMLVAFENSNTAGVTDTDAAGAATATKGFEFAVPFADVGLAYPSTTTVRVAAFLNWGDGTVGNQWLPGLGGGYPVLGIAPDLRDVPGSQFVSATLPLEAGGVPDPGPHAFAFTVGYEGDLRSAFAIALTLPEAAPVRLTVHDVRGRLVRSLVDGEVPAGEARYVWNGADASGRASSSGVYWVRLAAGPRQRALRAVLVR